MYIALLCPASQFHQKKTSGKQRFSSSTSPASHFCSEISFQGKLLATVAMDAGSTVPTISPTLVSLVPCCRMLWCPFPPTTSNTMWEADMTLRGSDVLEFCLQGFWRFQISRSQFSMICLVAALGYSGTPVCHGQTSPPRNSSLWPIAVPNFAHNGNHGCKTHPFRLPMRHRTFHLMQHFVVENHFLCDPADPHIS